MTTTEAQNNIGQPFKLTGAGMPGFDIIQSLREDGYIIGNFLDAPAEDCRLKQSQPEQLRKDYKPISPTSNADKLTLF